MSFTQSQVTVSAVLIVSTLEHGSGRRPPYTACMLSVPVEDQSIPNTKYTPRSGDIRAEDVNNVIMDGLVQGRDLVLSRSYSLSRTPQGRVTLSVIEA